MTLMSKPPSKDYDAGWEQTFGKQSPSVVTEEAEIARKLNEVLKSTFSGDPTPDQMELAVRGCREMAESYGLTVDDIGYSGSEIRAVITAKFPLSRLSINLTVPATEDEDDDGQVP